MKILILVAIMKLVSSCGLADYVIMGVPQGDPRTYSVSDPAFNTYKTLFEEEYYANTGKIISAKSITINKVTSLRDGTAETAAICYSWASSRYREILVKTSTWNSLSPESKTTLIKHELGHCVMNRQHDSSIVNGIPDSIMNPYVLSDQYSSRFYKEYNYELYTQNKTLIVKALKSF